MSRRFNNRKLLVVLGGLLILLLLTLVIKIPRERSTLKGTLVAFDTAGVELITIVPKAGLSEEFRFTRNNGRWNIIQGETVAVPVQGAVENILSGIMAIKPQTLAAVGKSAQEEYELTDSLATRIKVTGKRGRKLAEVLIGKFSYRQSASPYAGYGRNNFDVTTYVRLAGEEEVYAVDGFLALTFSGGFNDWRDKTFIRCKRDDINRITFTYPADSSFSLVKRDSFWFAGNQKADSLKVADYLSYLSLAEGREFADTFRPGSYPSYQILIEGNNLLSITVKCFRDGDDQFILNSSLNPGVYYSSDRDGMFAELFKPRNHFF